MAVLHIITNAMKYVHVVSALYVQFPTLIQVMLIVTVVRRRKRRRRRRRRNLFLANLNPQQIYLFLARGRSLNPQQIQLLQRSQGMSWRKKKVSLTNKFIHKHSSHPSPKGSYSAS